MDVSSIRERHDSEVRRLAQEYRDNGFTVDVDPPRSKLPVELQFSPDIVATRNTEKVLVEVKVAEGTADRNRWAELAAAAEHHGWLFRLVVIGAGESKFDYVNLPANEIADRLAKAEELYATAPEAGLLLAWAAFEAAGRRALLLEKVRERDPNGAALIKHLVHMGLLDSSDLKPLLESWRRRNAITHGQFAPRVPLGNDISTLAKLGHGLLKTSQTDR